MHDNQMDAIEPEVLVPAIAPERLELLPGVATSAITPLLIAEAGKLAEKAYWEYFVATIRNKNTRMAYARQVVKFFDWCTNASSDDPEFEGRDEQYFEVFTNRSIYNDGWKANAQHTLPWRQDLAPGEWEKDTWELYNLEKDFSEAQDLAAEMPDKLEEMKAKFDEAAEKHSVYPFDDRGAGRLAVPKPPVPGAKEGSKTFNYFEEHTVSKGDKALPSGEATIEVDFDYQGEKAGGPAALTLKVNGEKVAEGKMEATVGGRFGVDTFGIDQSSFFIADDGESKRDAVFIFAENALMAIRWMEYKVHFKVFQNQAPRRNLDESTVSDLGMSPWVYNLYTDPEEQASTGHSRFEWGIPQILQRAGRHGAIFKKYPPKDIGL